ncbi:uncharacterized protein LOC110019875 [Phalaenopsis equestris]|uniref:uncharacterized protein LOC110019875 n=1 Tax=Phalaenopsis equestris TaxID=78828 RepID=UPI0009E630FC|nr:uncharacterized protein LOC110019875 [Phalaenopsis equestris]
MHTYGLEICIYLISTLFLLLHLLLLNFHHYNSPMASVHPAATAFLLSLLFFAHLQLSMAGGFLSGSVSCMDCSPSHDLSGISLAVNCGGQKTQSYALTNINGQFLISVPNPPPPPSDCSVNLLGARTQLCGFKNSITSKIIAINSSIKSSNSSYALQTPLAFFTSCQKIIEQAKLEKTNGANNGGGAGLRARGPQSPPAEGFGLPPLPPLIYVFPFIPIIGIP